MERERIVAIGLLTDKEELSLLGPTFDRVGPVEEVLESERLGSHELLCGGSTKLTVGWAPALPSRKGSS